MRFHFFRLIAGLIICQIAGFIGSMFTITAIPGWSASLEKPPFNPPNWIFSAV